MRTWTILVLVLGVGIVACGGAEGRTDDGVDDRSPDRQVRSGQDACDLLRDGTVAPALGVEVAETQFLPGSESLDSMGRFLCTAQWPGSSPTEHHRVILTVMGEDYSTAAEAVASLESAVAFLVERAKTKAGEQGVPVQKDLERWLEGVGDRAAFVGNNLLVAAGGVRFTVNAKVGEPQDDHQRAITVAKSIVKAL